MPKLSIKFCFEPLIFVLCSDKFYFIFKRLMHYNGCEWMDHYFSDYIHFKDFELQVANLNGPKKFNIEWEECNKQVQNQIL
jgi:hypothetical protein